MSTRPILSTDGAHQHNYQATSDPETMRCKMCGAEITEEEAYAFNQKFKGYLDKGIAL